MDTIILVTDFGNGSPYVAEMKGAILSVNRHAQIVDGTHDVSPQDVTQAAMIVKQLSEAFPTGAVLVSVVDPGVGTQRDILLVQYRDRTFIAPDNGLLSLILDEATSVSKLDKPQYWRDPISATFHGRDIMGPAAAHLTRGVGTETMSSPVTGKPVRLAWPDAKALASEVQGELVFIDSFGNLISNIPGNSVDQRGQVMYRELTIPVRSTYAEQTVGGAVALIGSSGWLELAIVNGSAREHFDAKVGDEIRYLQPKPPCEN